MILDAVWSLAVSSVTALDVSWLKHGHSLPDAPAHAR